jgi:hypothetical protein
LRRPFWRGRLALLGGGPDGNEQLTAVTGVVLLVLLAVIGVTIVRIGQLIWLHLFLGLLLIGPVALKMGSTGYRFMRYYTNDQAYRRKGAPELWLRAIGPMIVISTIVVFVSGLLLLFEGASSRDRFLELHKVSFIVWVVFTGLHVLGHLPGLPRSLRAASKRGDGPEGSTLLSSPGEAGRWLVLAGVLVGGLVLAVALIPEFTSWTAHGALGHHHDHRG